jgi:hypothetical protein
LIFLQNGQEGVGSLFLFYGQIGQKTAYGSLKGAELLVFFCFLLLVFGFWKQMPNSLIFSANVVMSMFFMNQSPKKNLSITNKIQLLIQKTKKP